MMPLSALLLAGGFALVAAAPAPAGAADAPRAKPKPATRRVEGVRPWAFKRLERAHTALASGDLVECRAALAELQENPKRLNDHERALTWQTLGYVDASEERYAEAATSFERSLEGDGLPEAAKQDVRYNLAQLYVILKRYDEAIATFETWFAGVEDPPASAHYLLAMTYLQKDEHAKALPHARVAVEKADEPKEPWLQLLLSLLIQQGEFQEALPVVQRLVADFPKKTYWLQLSAVHSRLDQHREALAALEVAHAQGMLTTNDEIVRLAQLYMYNAVPERAARALADGLASGAVTDEAATWELLANAWLQARERRRAVEPLERAARLAGNGQLYVRLAQLQLDREEWAAARASLTAALQKGGLADPGQTQLLLGIANASEERWSDARTAFLAAQRHEPTREAATQWLASVDGELAMRDKEAEVAEAAAPDAKLAETNAKEEP